MTFGPLPTIWLMVLSVSACSLALAPERLDDVTWCETKEDCPDLGDNRFAQSCRLDDDEAPSTPGKICVPEYARVPCDPYSYGPLHPLAKLYEKARANKEAYRGRCDLSPGVQGCPPGPAGCAPGLTKSALTGACDDEDLTTPIAHGNGIPDLAGQDVLDQFCRSFFCDNSFVCDRSEDLCRPCEIGTFGRGGCGDLYYDGEPSPVYQSAAELVAGCRAPQSDAAHVGFGTVLED